MQEENKNPKKRKGCCLGTAAGIVVLIALIAAMAIIPICPPTGPWPIPPWCPGSPIDWPFGKPAASQGASTNPAITKDMPEDERLAMIAIGLISDLTSVNTFYQEATNAMGEAGNLTSTSSQTSWNQITMLMLLKSIQLTPFLLQTGQIPDGFTGPISASGGIAAPAGACALGALPTATFKNGSGENINADTLKEKDIQVVDFNEIIGESMGGNKIEQTITGYIGQGSQELTTPEGWNEQVWDKVAQLQTPAESLLDYHLWTVADDIENAVAESMRTKMEGMGLPAQVIDAFDASNHDQWMTNKEATDEDKISAMEIVAEFTGRTTGTIHETREFALPTLGKMPEFGPMTGEGKVVYHDPDLGDYPFDLTLIWTKWDELGRVTAGTSTFIDSQKGYEIRLEVFEDTSREGEVYLEGQKVGLVHMDSNGKVEYEKLTGD